MGFKFELDNNLMYEIKDAIMVQFLKDDLNCIKQNLANSSLPADTEYDKKLIKAYKRILDYYGQGEE